MAHAMTLRLDEQTERELSELAAGQPSRNAVVIDAIHLAYQRLREEQLRAEAEALVNDPEDRAEIRAVRADLDAVDAW